MDKQPDLASFGPSFSPSVAVPTPARAPAPALNSRTNPSLSPFISANNPSSRPGSIALSGNVHALPQGSRSSVDITRASSPRLQFRQESADDQVRNLIQRGFVPHVAVLASSDTENIIRKKGLPGGLLELLAPFGESIPGKVSIRDGNGLVRKWSDFGVRFVAYSNYEKEASKKRHSTSMTVSDDIAIGGRIPEIERLVKKHLDTAELNLHSGHNTYSPDQDAEKEPRLSQYYSLYLQKLLSGFPVVPHETFSHPVACMIAISSSSQSPIKTLVDLYKTTTPDRGVSPNWMSNDFLRYYVLVHDEDNDDIAKSTALYEQMKSRYGNHCQMLRIRTEQCVSSDDDAEIVGRSEWLSASKELDEIAKLEQEANEIEDSIPCIFESDLTSIRVLVREMVQQSIILTMERHVANWNESILSKRKGFSGRFVSFSKKLTTSLGTGKSFGGSGLFGGPSKSNYNPEHGTYTSDSPEASLRKLADFNFMLRDYKSAYEVYDLLRHDYESDHAWKYYAGASEMTAISALMLLTHPPDQVSRVHQTTMRAKIGEIETCLQTALYSYLRRSLEPYYALRTITTGMELFRCYNSSQAGTDALLAKKALDSNLLAAIGYTLYTERLAICYENKLGLGLTSPHTRQRQAAFWAVNATRMWLEMGLYVQAERQLEYVRRIYGQLKARLAKDNEKITATFSYSTEGAFMPEIDQALHSFGQLIEARKRELAEARGYQDGSEAGEPPVQEEETSETVDESPGQELSPSPTRLEGQMEELSVREKGQEDA